MTDTLVIKDEACGCEVSVWQAQKKFHSRHRLGIWYGGLHSQRIDWKKKTSKLQAKKTLEQLPSTKRQTLRVEATCLYVSSSSFYKRKLRYYRNLLSGDCNIFFRTSPLPGDQTRWKSWYSQGFWNGGDSQDKMSTSVSESTCLTLPLIWGT